MSSFPSHIKKDFVITCKLYQNGEIPQVTLFNYIELLFSDNIDSNTLIDYTLKNFKEDNKYEIMNQPLYIFCILNNTNINSSASCFISQSIKLGEVIYQCKSVIYYKGNSRSGHYIVVTNINDIWYCVNDSFVYLFDFQNINYHFPDLCPHAILYSNDKTAFPYQLIANSYVYKNIPQQFPPLFQQHFFESFTTFNIEDINYSYFAEFILFIIIIFHPYKEAIDVFTQKGNPIIFKGAMNSFIQKAPE